MYFSSFWIICLSAKFRELWSNIAEKIGEVNLPPPPDQRTYLSPPEIGLKGNSAEILPLNFYLKL